VVWLDALARIVLAPEDLPIGVVTGLVGGSSLFG
jgi:iron complex transport system permease protein